MYVRRNTKYTTFESIVLSVKYIKVRQKYYPMKIIVDSRRPSTWY